MLCLLPVGTGSQLFFARPQAEQPQTCDRPLDILKIRRMTNILGTMHDRAIGHYIAPWGRDPDRKFDRTQSGSAWKTNWRPYLGTRGTRFRVDCVRGDGANAARRA